MLDIDIITKRVTEKVLSVLVARHLSGRDVSISWQDPGQCAYGKALGQSLREGNKGIIEIMPGLDDERMLAVLLHECAHARLHFDTAPTKAQTLRPGISNMPVIGERIKQYHRQREREAIAQAQAWQRWADARGDTLADKLTALLKWQPFEGY